MKRLPEFDLPFKKGTLACIKDNLKRKMELKESKAIYSKRLGTVEPVFAHIEEGRGFRRFSVWGLAKAKAQWTFVCFVQNISKLLKYWRPGVVEA